MRLPYDHRPAVAVAGTAVRGYPAIAEMLAASGARVIVADLYPGADAADIERGLLAGHAGATVIRVADAMRPSAEIEAMLARFLTNDRVFGYRAPFLMAEFFDEARLAALRTRIDEATGPVLVIGVGAALVTTGDLLVYADMPRWEIQLRMRKGLGNWSADNGGEDILRKYKRGFFVEWRTADRHKTSLFDSVDFFLDTTAPGDPKLVAGDAMRAALAHVAGRPFRVVPFFDPGVWGGQWMREAFGLPDGPPNYAWGFDCVPEENSLLLRFGGIDVEVPSINLVFRHPEALLGPKVYARFGTEFPIRFDFLDTMGGGNLSLQVHPKTEYIQETFGMAYTQDESYYMLQAGPDAAVYLGFRNGVKVEDFLAAVETAQAGGPPLDVEAFVNRWPARKHDHFSIPAGTIHCSGDDCVVLEISATPFIFTFKLWDWSRLGLDGLPRPVHLEHGEKVLVAERDTDWAKASVIDTVEPIAEGDGWREERTGLHELEFIETRRHWFDKPVVHRTEGSVHVLNLVEGDRIRVESPDGAFEPFEAGYAETFIVPASVAEYRVTPLEPGSRCGTIRASVRI
jgi:hypothetical protein